MTNFLPGCTSKVEGWADRRVSIVEGGEGALPPPPLKMLSEGILTFCTYVLLMKLGGSTNTAYMQNGRGWADRRLSMVGEGGALPPPLENEKKRLSEEILTAFTYVLLIK